MNESERDVTELLDRLVDGHLTGPAYRQLLMDLETQPNGWRRCALAFLEAQAWRGELQALQHECARAVSPSTARALPAGRHRVIEWVLAVAAGLLIALPLSTLLRRPPEAVVAPPVMETSEAVETTETARVPNGRPEDVPVEGRETGYEWWLGEEGSALPAELVRALESLGTQIRRERSLLPVQTEDGQRFVMPIERVEITPIRYSQYR